MDHNNCLVQLEPLKSENSIEIKTNYIYFTCMLFHFVFIDYTCKYKQKAANNGILIKPSNTIHHDYETVNAN